MTASARHSASTTRTETTKRRVFPIEEVLRWAIRDELPKRRLDPSITQAPSLPSVHPMWGNGLFTRVDNWSREPGMPLALGECHPDAEVIEAEIRNLDAEALDLAPYQIGHGLGPQCEVERISRLVRRDVIAWLITYAKKGGRPDLGEHVMCEPALSANGKVTVWRTVSTLCGTDLHGKPLFITSDKVAVSKGDARDTGLFCKLHWTRNADDVAEDRARYAVWHAALAHLTERLSGLSSVEVRAPIAPATPWISQPTPPAALQRLIPANDTDLPPARHPAQRPRPRPASAVRHIDPATYPLVA
ncbi:hypothetical protein [Methylobacterium soli]|uniref:Uncharacterized protein n=1 Tax=Methylobacterium soli TaxID=553447 RepID=A0A6L3SUK5_9HYPH|nr:hypothetical protein [Methylobacterium soli]KAB1075441.1 hypothetical protein F6X53_25090 [Methylobacterium soli]